ncbi:unnamed protein product [Durusdinium trenchii]|uniref:DNA-directed RNA polymerase n=1 Tax=Durusdinium trenchii TaxID=1381693 RepID=A0ABP0IU35_9DINO
MFASFHTQGITFIEQALRTLEERGYQDVRARIFGDRLKVNDRWSHFFQDPRVEFRAVDTWRAKQEAEPVDEAVMAEARRLAQLRAETPRPLMIALLVDDAGYARWLCEQGRGCVDLALCPDSSWGVKARLEEAPVKTLYVKTQRRAQKVRAVLHANGTGSVRLASSFIAEEQGEMLEVVQNFLMDLHYGDGGSYWPSSLAKFWFTNQLGKIIVYPVRFSLEAVYRLINRGSRRVGWKDGRVSQKNLAFVLPRGDFSARDPLDSKYGSMLDCEVYEGGGPMMLHHSQHLVPQVLRRLGYLDHEYNTDLAEAMFVFINQKKNKELLRKHGHMRAASSAQEIEARLRDVFVAPECSGHWRLARPQDVRLLEHLRREGFLGEDEAKSNVFQAMKSYCKERGLPQMKTYGGCTTIIMNSLRMASRRLFKFEL